MKTFTSGNNKMNIYLLLVLITKIYEVSNLPSSVTASKLITDITHSNPIEHNTIPSSTREKKGLNLPYQYHIQQLYVQNLHVIPLDTNVTTHTNLIPLLIPVHSLVPVHDLTVIPLSHRVAEKVYRMNNEADLYRNPLGGYGVGWRFGGHGAGHGFHYAYG